MAIGRRKDKLRVQGVDKVIRNLDREIRRIKGRSVGGLVEAGLHIIADAIPRTPRETGNLRGSANVMLVDVQRPAVAVFYQASYAVPVHEIPNEYKEGDWKFLEGAVHANAGEILQIVRNSAKVGHGKSRGGRGPKTPKPGRHLYTNPYPYPVEGRE